MLLLYKVLRVVVRTNVFPARKSQGKATGFIVKTSIWIRVKDS